MSPSPPTIFLTSSGMRIHSSRLLQLAMRQSQPFWLYDSAAIVDQIRQLRQFDTIRYAQKANSNTHILRIMRQEGVLLDAVSAGEIERARHAGFHADDEPSGIVFTADVIDRHTIDQVILHRIPVNAGSIDMLDQLGPLAPGHAVWLRINPGFGDGHSHKTNTGGTLSKHGIWHEDLSLALLSIRRHRLKLVGLHMHIGSGVNYEHLARVCKVMADTVLANDCDISAISAGGGLSVPYRETDPTVNCAHYFALWDEARKRVERHLGHPVRLEIEPGRFLIAKAGVLVAEVRAVKRMGPHLFVLTNAGFNDLMRPAMYGGYHHISLLSRDGSSVEDRPIAPCIIAGPLCESGDVFTHDLNGQVAPRELQVPQVGDFLVFHDAGAYGAAMSSNYNSRPLVAEFLMEGEAIRQIRRPQRMQELLALEEDLATD